MRKKILFFKSLFKIFFLILFCNNVNAADTYVGSGDLKLDDPDVKWFLKYLKPPAGQIPMTFFVLSENGKAIWSTYWYCPEGNCQTLSKKVASQKCTLNAEKYYKRSIFEECKVFAQRRTIVWKNGINPGRGKVSRASSKWDEKKLRANGYIKFIRLNFSSIKKFTLEIKKFVYLKTIKIDILKKIPKNKYLLDNSFFDCKKYLIFKDI